MERVEQRMGKEKRKYNRPKVTGLISSRGVPRGAESPRPRRAAWRAGHARGCGAIARDVSGQAEHSRAHGPPTTATTATTAGLTHG
jgi:hypothetical protein